MYTDVNKFRDYQFPFDIYGYWIIDKIHFRYKGELKEIKIYKKCLIKNDKIFIDKKEIASYRDKIRGHYYFENLDSLNGIYTPSTLEEFENERILILKGGPKVRKVLINKDEKIDISNTAYVEIILSKNN